MYKKTLKKLETKEYEFLSKSRNLDNYETRSIEKHSQQDTLYPTTRRRARDVWSMVIATSVGGVSKNP